MRLRYALVLTALLLPALAASAQNDGDLDLGFDGDGYVEYSPGNPIATGGLAVFPDDRLLIGGRRGSFGTSSADVARFLANGALDLTYGGGDGETTLLAPDMRAATDLVVDDAGRAVVLFYTEPSFPNVGNAIGLARFLADGTPDATFGTGGLAMLDLPYDGEAAFDLLALPGGALLLAGGTYDGTTDNDREAIVVRVTTAGALDTTFGVGGVATYDTPQWEAFNALALDGTGRIVAAGHSTPPGDGANSGAFTAARFSASGVLDTDFGTGGATTLRYYTGPSSPTAESATALAIQPDGRIVLGGYVRKNGEDPNGPISFSAFGATRLLPDGAHDLSFGTAARPGWIEPDNFDAAPGDVPSAVLLNADGKIILAGTCCTSGFDGFPAAIRLLANGQRDLDFGDALGRAYAFGPPSRETGVRLETDAFAFQSTGKIIGAGANRYFGGAQTILFRFHNSPPIPVELTAFAATLDGDRARLAWATASETNNAGFEVQHRAPGQPGFAALGFVEGHGTTAEPQRYAFTTDALAAGTHAFRLRQVDFDGAYEHSETVEVTVGTGGAFTLSAAVPNPSHGSVGLMLTVTRSQAVRATLHDALGREVARLFEGAAVGGTPLALRVPAGLAPGVYAVRVAGEAFAATRALTVVR